MKILYFFLLIFIFTSGYAQTTIKGKVLGENKIKLSGASVTVSQDTTSSILNYHISNEDGDFKLHVNSVADSLFLKISYIGYKTWIKSIYNKDQDLEIQLSPTSEALEEVLVESKIIEQRGDTLSYSVAEFKNQRDRVIADVIRKMPGIEIMPGGQIEYQGEPIEKYYIEGLDLLEGRYSLANNNISADDVSRVQILENHHPIKLLDSLTFSENASLNIKLKKDVTVSGSAELGSGFSPLLWKVNMTPMLFTKKNQAIVTYQTNNVGSNVSIEINDFSIADFGRKEFNTNKSNWLSIQRIAEPPFEPERWLDNNVHLGSANYLIRLKKDIDLKTNISYLNDFQNQIGNTETRFFLPNDTIDLIESTSNKIFVKSLQSNFIIEKNVNDNYLKNELEINGDWDSQEGNIDTRNSNIRQDLQNPFSKIQNKLKWIQPLGKQLITFRSNTGFTKTNQNLSVQPEQIEELFNIGNYDEVIQHVKSASFFSDNSAGFTKKIGAITISPEVGLTIRNQSLESQLVIFDNDELVNLDQNFINNLNFLDSRLYASSRFVYQENDWNFRLTTPFNYRKFNIEKFNLNKLQNLERFTFEPNLYIRKKISAYWEASMNINLTNDFGKVDQIYNGFIMTNYRNLQSFDSPIPNNFSQNYSWKILFRNPLESLFANVSYSFGRTKRNLLYSNRIRENGTTLLEAIERENFNNSHRLNLAVSKYLGKINTTISLGSNYQTSTREQLINEKPTKIENKNLAFNLDLESDVAKWLSSSYNGSFNFIKTRFETQDLTQIGLQQHELKFIFYPSTNQFFEVDSDYYFNSISEENRHIYFLNLNYQYTFKETGIDLVASWNNILNTDKFIRFSNNEFTYVQSTYNLRPSQVLVSLKFSF